LALADETGSLTDVAMPAEGTDAHATLLVAEFLADRQRAQRLQRADEASASVEALPEQDIADFLGRAKDRYGRYWRKSARVPDAERELAAIAIERLEKLQLVERSSGLVMPRPALARFALGAPEVRDMREASTGAAGAPGFEWGSA
jgi:uncharacterized protein (TIGR02678 family)